MMLQVRTLIFIFTVECIVCLFLLLEPQYLCRPQLLKSSTWIQRGTQDARKGKELQKAKKLQQENKLLKGIHRKRTRFFHGCLEGVVTLQAGGRFGNLFMGYASALGVARTYNLTLLLPELTARAMRAAFQDAEEPTVGEYLKGRNGTDGEPCAPRLNEGDVVGTVRRWTIGREPLLRGDGPIVMIKYTMHEKYVARLAPWLRANRHFRPELRDRAQTLLRALGQEVAAATGARREEVLYVGIHVRRTDYLPFLNDYFLVNETADESYYVPAVAFLRKTLEEERAEAENRRPPDATTPTTPPPLAVVVVSDDMAWVKNTLIPAFQSDADAHTATTRVFAASTGKEEDGLKDLALLAACNHSVLSYGTFGITAALFAGGRAVFFPVKSTDYHTVRFVPRFENWTFLK